VPRGVIRNELFEDIAAQRSSAQDSQNFKGDNVRISNAPSEISTCVFFPKRGERSFTRNNLSSKGREVKPGALDDKADKGIKRQPDKGVAVLPPCISGEEVF